MDLSKEHIHTAALKGKIAPFVVLRRSSLKVYGYLACEDILEMRLSGGIRVGIWVQGLWLQGYEGTRILFSSYTKLGRVNYSWIRGLLRYLGYIFIPRT